MSNDLNMSDPAPTDDFLNAAYEPLRRLAAHRMAREWPGHTLQATALVHEAYLRVARDPDVRWANQRHFFGAAAQAMRRILVEWARGRAADKRGGDRARSALDEVALAYESRSVDLISLDEALTELARHDQRKCDIVALRFFAGLTIAETAAALNVSHATIERDWTYVRAWLHRRLGPA